MPDESWSPTSSLTALNVRASLYRYIRDFFTGRQVLEVDVPVLSPFATVDPFIDSLHTEVMGQTQYLQTSPEFYLKRILAAYQQDIYSLGKAFRQDEKGARHHPEFTMLEWYRVGWDEQRLMDEVRDLLQGLLPSITYQSWSYRDLFLQHVLLDPHTATVDELRTCAQSHVELSFDSGDINMWLDILFTHVIEPQLPKGLVGVFDYPASQAALARTAMNEQQQTVAKRFEMYLDGIELANGYWELTDADEQLRRFEADCNYRQAHRNNDHHGDDDNALSERLPYDTELVTALREGGFPDCAGVALGIDRWLMAILKTKDIRDVLSFT